MTPPHGKIDSAVQELRSRGVGAFTAAPPLFRFLWWVGIHAPPPLFLSFRASALGFAAVFAAGWIPMQWLVRGGQLQDAVAVELAIAVCAGVAFGVLSAAYLRYRARKLGLPSWEEYVANHESRGGKK